MKILNKISGELVQKQTHSFG